MTIIIAEIGTAFADPETPHRLAKAQKLIGKALAVGADVVKIQFFLRDKALFCPMPGDDARCERWNNSVLSIETWSDMAATCRAAGRAFAASIFQPEATRIIYRTKPAFIKVASRAAKTFPYDQCPGPFLVSNGMGLPDKLPDNAKVLSCVSKYPTPLREAFWPGDTAGLSDHSGSILPGLDAIERGAEYLEVHFDDGYGDGPDRAVSLNPDQLRKLCEARDAARSRAAPSGRRARAH